MTTPCPDCTLRIAGLLDRIDKLEQERDTTVAELALSNAKNAALRREMTDLRDEMVEVVEVVAAEVEARKSSLTSSVTTVVVPVGRRRRSGRDTAEVTPETMAQVIEGGRK